MRLRPEKTGAELPYTFDATATAAFRAVSDEERAAIAGAPRRAVVIGGGTGAPVSIRTMLNLGAQTSAVVAMADDGGSTGILRDVAGATTPGDVRKCLSAFARDADDPLTQAFRLRFSFADGHTLGNLMISALERTAGSFTEAIRICERLLDAQGHVHPSTLSRVTLEAVTRDGQRIEGQALACHARTALSKVRLISSAPIVAFPSALDALRHADVIVLGPGSLYTSIIPNLLVPGIVDAIRASRAAVVFVCSLADMQGETRGMSVLEHYQALRDHGMAGLIDWMIVHRPARTSRSVRTATGDLVDVRSVAVDDDQLAAIESAGTRLIVGDFADPQRPTWHEPHALHEAFREVLDACRSRRR